MRLHRLRVQNFASIREMDVELGPGLNVLYGPNDLGKSTLADAIRLVLLLPHTSTYCEPYVPWTGAQDPFVDLTFETEAERFWRVRKQFGKRGSSLLQESRNGQDFDDVERARGVDARLREILRWGIPEPGGTGAAKGLPTSFLATALLSTQANVSDLLDGSLSDDSTPTGKDQIAAALEAVAQDPLFVSLLRETQERRDEAYTEKGAKKTARGSVFKAAADRVKETRKEKEDLQKIVDDSEGVERRHRDLLEERERLEQERAEAADRSIEVQGLARQAADRATAAERVRVALEAVLRIEKMELDVADSAAQVETLAGGKAHSERTLEAAQTAEVGAGEALAAAEEAARSAGLGSDLADTVARQALELRQVAAEKAAREARQSLAAAAIAQERVDAARRAEREHREQETEALRAQKRWAEAAKMEQAAQDELHRCDLLARGLEARAAETQVASAQADVARESALQAEWTKVSGERVAAAELRAAILVPPAGSLPALRKLATDLASARGALDVGLVMTVIPAALVPLRVRKDGGAVEDQGVVAQPLEIEADTEVEVYVADLVTVRVRGGRRETQERVRSLESRWDAEALPHLQTAGVADLDALDAKRAEARDLEARLQSLDGSLDSLGRQLTALAGAAGALGEASARAATCHLELGDVPIETLAADLAALGPEPGAALRGRRHQASRDLETARTTAAEAATAQTLAKERVRTLQASLEAIVVARDTALAEFPSGVAAGTAVAEEALGIALQGQETVEAELASLENRMEARRGQFEAALADAREATEKAHRDVEVAQGSLAQAIADHASEVGRLAELRKLRAAADLPAAERELREAAEAHDALPVPERAVTPEEVVAAEEALARARQGYEAVDREIQRTQGALQQVGGAVARDRLRDAIEAFEQAERQDREIEEDYEAWRLLLEQMKAADAAQASNLGQVLAPAIAARFQALTEQRYHSLQLTAHLGTEGIVVAGALRSPERISVGTREQLSTLYRLCLGEYLQTTIVLDDQLVQSDDSRMEWFRALLAEKARSFQIIVFTCRPGDYLVPGAMVAGEGMIYADSEEGFVRAVDLGQIAR